MKSSPKKKATDSKELPTRSFATPRAFSEWLAKNHASSRGIWLRLAKKASGKVSITYAEAVEVALVWGWIDGQKQRGDETSWLQKFTPRRARSMWSKINREKALALIEAGAMQPAGLAEVERAKQDGRWDVAYDPPSRATVPEDLEKALAKNAKASAFFQTLDARNRFAVLWRVQTAKKVETRQKRIAVLVAMLARGRRCTLEQQPVGFLLCSFRSHELYSQRFFARGQLWTLPGRAHLGGTPFGRGRCSV